MNDYFKIYFTWLKNINGIAVYFNFLLIPQILVDKYFFRRKMKSEKCGDVALSRSRITHFQPFVKDTWGVFLKDAECQSLKLAWFGGFKGEKYYTR